MGRLLGNTDPNEAFSRFGRKRGGNVLRRLAPTPSNPTRTVLVRTAKEKEEEDEDGDGDYIYEYHPPKKRRGAPVKRESEGEAGAEEAAAIVRAKGGRQEGSTTLESTYVMAQQQAGGQGQMLVPVNAPPGAFFYQPQCVQQPYYAAAAFNMNPQAQVYMMQAQMAQAQVRRRKHKLLFPKFLKKSGNENNIL